MTTTYKPTKQSRQCCAAIISILKTMMPKHPTLEIATHDGVTIVAYYDSILECSVIGRIDIACSTVAAEYYASHASRPYLVLRKPLSDPQSIGWLADRVSRSRANKNDLVIE